MTELFKRRFVHSAVEDLLVLDGEEFERVCGIIMEIDTAQVLLHKGQNLFGKPVGYAVDHQSNDGTLAGQCGTDKNYFTDFNKPISDADNTRKRCLKCQKLYLFSNIRASADQLKRLDEQLLTKEYNFVIEVWDAERIAKFVSSHLDISRINDVLEYLASAKELNKYCPHFFSVPLQSAYAIRRETVINNIRAKLEHEPIVQLYGLSGIGKSELAKQVVLELKDNYDLCYWLDGTNGSVNFDCVQNSENYRVNISSILENYKVLLVIDNLNEQVDVIVRKFAEHNKNSSVCIITSQKRTLDGDSVYAVNELQPEESRRLIDSYGTDITDEQKGQFINYVNGYPLSICLACACVQKGEATWKDVIDSLSDIVELEDERNHQIFARILTPVFDKYRDSLIAIARFQSTEIGADYLKKCVNAINLMTLKSYSLILPINEDVVYVHQMVIDSILKMDACVVDANEVTRLCTFLDENNQLRPIEYHVLLHKNMSYVNEVYKIANSEQQKIILYACLQVCDFKALPDDLLNKWKILMEDNNYSHYDCLLAIEKTESTFLERDDPKYEEDVLEKINFLMEYDTNTTDIDAKNDLMHHIGKLYSRIDRMEDALAQFERVLNQSTVKAYSTIYQIGQLYHFHNDYPNAECYYDQVLSADEGLVPLSVLLACFGRIAKKEYNNLAQKWVLDRIDVFRHVIIRMLNIDADLAIQTVGKWVYKLEYKNPAVLEDFLSFIPIVPAEHSDHRGMAFLNAIRYRMLSDKTSHEAQMVLSIAESEFLKIPKINDYQRKRLFELYLDANALDKAEALITQFEDQNNVFNLQIFAKYYAKVGNWSAALGKINTAIEEMDDVDYKSSFMWNKACFLHEMGDSNCLSMLDQAMATRKTEIPEEWGKAKTNWEMTKNK